MDEETGFDESIDSSTDDVAEVEEDEIAEEFSDPDAEAIEDDSVAEFEPDVIDDVVAEIHGNAAAALAAARDLDGYDGPTYDLVDQDGNVIDTFRADRPHGFELAEGQSIVTN